MSKRKGVASGLVDTDIPGLRRRIKMAASTVPMEADRYNVGVETIRRALRGETFRHIKDYLPEPDIPGEHAEHATRHPIPPPDELLDEINESLGRVVAEQSRLSEPKEGEPDALDEFLAKRGNKEKPSDHT